MNDDTKEMLYKVGGMGDPNGRYPQPWVGLTDEERNALLHLTITHSAIEFGKAIEAKLRDKNI